MNNERRDCQPMVYNDKFTGLGSDGWAWTCCFESDGHSGLHYERLDAAEEAYAHKIGEF